VVPTVHSIRSVRASCQSIEKRQPSIGSGWQNGISSWVLLHRHRAGDDRGVDDAALGALQAVVAQLCGDRGRERHPASGLRLRAVTGFAETSTIAGRPVGSRWVSVARFFVMRGLSPPQPPTRYISTCLREVLASLRTSL
jgi:hypothetical protein